MVTPNRWKTIAHRVWRALEAIGRQRAAIQLRAQANLLEHSRPELARELRQAAGSLLAG
jgi:hypothetical protein